MFLTDLNRSYLIMQRRFVLHYCSTIMSVRLLELLQAVSSASGAIHVVF
jgi:hypothetical protein